MDELGSVLREVLRALGMDGTERARVACGPAEGTGEPADGPEEELSAG
ncbi:MAG TPA: hypothetical protein VGO40_15270 [Longimicrobium sp.]|jgi:hypothetical protein|nr:hypothetical protein [Longimicrobium sp.]